MPYILAALIGMVALAVALVHATRRLKETEAMIAKANARRQAQVDRIKRVARQTLAQARELRDAKRRKTSIEFACEELEQKLKAANAADKRVFVLDDRRTQADLGWIVKLANPDYAQKVGSHVSRDTLGTWKKGRRYIVWALDEQKARDKVAARFPESKGFYVQSVKKRER